MVQLKSAARQEFIGQWPPIIAAQTTYLLYASDNNQNFKISKLDANYYNVDSQTSVIPGSFAFLAKRTRHAN
ncbi:hypothetical protein H0H81_006623 [Sphagnurus paluster]|uniref:Uncharacterized protein n=1 Tax=Sphagnurus paluster TaxID=117069 RepID=A0A9P7GNZ6_9AGAR|nr:hypothetical protein H0H81_006623 [Sphagnurus paluster]